MGGLVAYGSSDEDDEDQESVSEKTETCEKVTKSANHPELCERRRRLESHASPQAAGIDLPSDDAGPPQAQAATTTAPERKTSAVDAVTGPVPQLSALIGPSLPPIDLRASQDPLALENDTSQPPASPYTASRTLLRDLTLPPVPNLDIPPSPSGSPPPALEAKFAQFVGLKKKGVHFNAKLAQSAALRNPSLTDKLMDFVDLHGRAGYATTLPHDLWDPMSEEVFPEWAMKAALRQSQEKVRAERAALRKGGGPVDFVPAVNTGASEVGSPSVAEGGLSRTGKRKTGAL